MSTTYTLQGGTFTRTFTSQALQTLSFKLLASQQSYFRVDGIAVILLSENGYLLLMQVDGARSTAARTLFDNYTFAYDPSYEHQIRLTSKTLSGNATFSQALTAHSFLGLVPLGSLDTSHAFSFIIPPPGPPRHWAIDNSEETTQLLRRQSHQHTHRTQLNDFSQDDTWLFKLAKTFVANNYQPATLQLDGNPCSIITTRALGVENLGSGAFLVGGPTALKPLITISVSSPHTVQAQTGQTLTVPSASAVDPLTSGALSVQANPGTVDLGVLGTTVVTYTAQTSAGDLSSALLDFVVSDSTSPALTLQGAASMTLAVGATYTGPGFSASDNLDGVITSSAVVSGDTVSTAVPATFTINYSVTDSSGLSAFASRTVVVGDPALYEAAGPWTSPQWFSTGLGTSFTSEVDQMSRGTNYGYEVGFTYKRGSDPQGVVLSVTDSSYTDRRYEGPTSTAAIAFRADATWGIMVRLPQSHSSWGSTRYIYEALGYSSWSSAAVYGHTQTNWNKITCRIFDKDASNWGLVMFINTASSGSQYISRTFSKGFPNGNQLSFPGRTSSWTGYSVLGVETGGAITTSGGWRVDPDGEVKGFYIKALHSGNNHTQP